MKFRDPKTGEAMTVEDAVEKFCAKNRCDDNSCILGNALTDGYEECFSWAWDNPAEASILMGYELVDDHLPDPTKRSIPRKNPLQYIFDTFGRDEIVAQAAEEATELAQALLKLRRAYRGTTPVSVENALEQVREEHNDLTLCMDVLLSCNDEPIGDTGVIRYEKLERWVERAKEYEKRVDRTENP